MKFFELSNEISKFRELLESKGLRTFDSGGMLIFPTFTKEGALSDRMSIYFEIEGLDNETNNN